MKIWYQLFWFLLNTRYIVIPGESLFFVLSRRNMFPRGGFWIRAHLLHFILYKKIHAFESVNCSCGFFSSYVGENFTEENYIMDLLYSKLYCISCSFIYMGLRIRIRLDPYHIAESWSRSVKKHSSNPGSDKNFKKYVKRIQIKGHGSATPLLPTHRKTVQYD